jgi:isoleucyl-tRNA synthetase
LADALAHGKTVAIALSDERVELSPDDVQLIQEITQGYGVASEGGITVAMALLVTDELRLEGLARELVRLVQEARRAAELNVSDRIDLGIRASGTLALAFAQHRGYIAGETLAISIGDAPLSGGYRLETEVEGEPVTVTVRMAVPKP